MTRRNLGRRAVNWNLAVIPVLVILMVLSLLNMRNADYYSGDLFHQRQVIWYLLAIIVAVVTAVLDFRLFERLAWPLYIAITLLLLVTLIWGKEVNNARRWIEVFGLTVQPSEYLKLSLILLLARELRERHRAEYHTLKSLWKILLYALGPSLLVLVEPDLGTTLLILGVALSMILYEGMRLGSLLWLVGLVALVFPVAWHFNLIQDYQKDRFRLWINPEQFKWDPEAKKILDKNMQPEQAVWAIGAGGFLGKGAHMGSKARLKYLPEMQTDFIITTYAEERGFVGCMFLLALYLAMLLWGLHVARHARDRFGVLVAVGVTSYLAWQAFMNIGMVTGLLPVVGITLPLLSYGGSSLLSVMAGLGLLFNIAWFKGRA
ncbi:MAG: rod shape-determining protein RodA [Deltaproteobacteria bacterium]|nr:rod shape-determining protein RodA [Deltaproteobacteria bacterium]